MSPAFDGTGYIVADVSLAILVTISALVTYGRLSFDQSNRRHPIPRSLMACGFTLLSMRFWISIYMNIDIMIAPLSMVALSMICFGYCVIQLRAMSRCIAIRNIHIRCLREPSYECHREDRIEKAIAEKEMT